MFFLKQRNSTQYNYPVDTKGSKKPKVNVITLGCSKNLVDSENIITQLRAGAISAEHEHSASAAEIVIVNTCGFIDRAKEESVDTILRFAELKTQGQIKTLYVTGCLSERYKDQLKDDIPEVDAFFGTMDLPALLAKFDADYKHELLGERQITTLSHYAYLKIAEGCNRTCSFCAIPIMRGGHVSVPIEQLVKQTNHLVRQGVVEIILIAQELTYYGLDLYKKRALAQLLDALAQVDGLKWIRLHYAYPGKFPLDVLDVIKKYDNICNYLDMPLQHAADRVLHRMKRQITQKQTRALIHKIREVIPDITLRTTMLVGFPGETEEDFSVLMDFVKEMRFDRLGVFMYSHEEDTAAHAFVDDVAPDVKVERMNRLMSLQASISLEKNRAKIGRVAHVLIDRRDAEAYYGRTEGDSPEVDNEVIISADQGYLRVGDFVRATIVDATEYDLLGQII